MYDIEVRPSTHGDITYVSIGLHESDPQLQDNEVFPMDRTDLQELYNLIGNVLGMPDPVPHLRRLQYAANMLNGNEFADAQGWPRPGSEKDSDGYVRHKFEEFQKLGRLHVFDDGVLRNAIVFYETAARLMENRRKAQEQGILPGSQEERTPAGPVIGTNEVGPRRHTERKIEPAPEDR